MIYVKETSPSNFEVVALRNEVIDSLNGEHRAPLETLMRGTWSDAQLADFGLYRVQEAEVPVGKRPISTSYERVDGKIIQTHELEDLPPPKMKPVSPRQLKLALLAAGLLDDIESFVAAADKAVQISWEYATEFDRDDPLLNQMAQAFGMTSENVDAMFAQAAQI